MKNKKIKFLSGVSSLIVAFSAISTGFVSATEPNPSMPNLSESDSVSIMADYIRNASEKEVFDAIESGRAMELPLCDFAHSLSKNEGIELKGKFKLFSYYTFIRVLTEKGEPLPTDEEINWGTYSQPDYKFCLDIGYIVWKNGYYGESEPSEKDGEDEVKNFHYLFGAIIRMTEEKKNRVIPFENAVIIECDEGDKVEEAFEMLEIACKYL